MSDTQLLWLIPAAILVLVTILVLSRRGKPAEPVPDVELATPPSVAMTALSPVEPSPVHAPEPQDVRPSAIVIGTSPDAPMITVRPLSSLSALESAEPLDSNSRATVDRLSPLLQAVPSMLVAQQATGRQLMEVVIDGNLVAAADGNGLRAFAMGPQGIAEHARLFDAANLQHMINAAALWQVASVLVAQKHLADISRKLDGIQKGIGEISHFLDNQRKARITGTYKYLLQIHVALQGGELPDAARHELESCERDLIEILDHLMVEYRQKATEAVEAGNWGTKRTCHGVDLKLTELGLLARDIAVCIETRIAAWVILSLYPGNSQQKMARRDSIEAAISAFEALGPLSRSELESEIGSIKSIWNKAKTIESRRELLSAKCTTTVHQVSQLSARALEQIRQSDQYMLRASSPTRLLMHVEHGVVVAVEQST